MGSTSWFIDSMGETFGQALSTAFGRLRLAGLRGKLIIPYALLTLILAALGIFVVTRLVAATIEERFASQMYAAADVASDSIVRQERSNLENLRALVYTQGVQEALIARDVGRLEELLLPLAANYDLDALTIVDPQGVEILTLGKTPEGNSYTRTQGTDLSENDLVQKIVSGVVDEQGDKHVGVLQTNYGPALFTGVAVTGSLDEIMGGVLAGSYLGDMVVDIKDQAQSDIAIFDGEGRIIATTLVEPEEGFAGLEAVTRAVPEGSPQDIYDLDLYEREYKIAYTPFQPRQERLGWLGVVKPSRYVVTTESASRNLYSLIFTLGTLAIIVVGYFLSRNIANPILKLRSLTQAVAAGDLDQEIRLQRSDEIGELAVAFDQMTLRLRERTEEAARLYAEAIQRNKELAETNKRLRETQLQLIQSEKMGAIGQLAAGIVHDVKNPLTVIRGVSELMLTDDNLPAELNQEVSLIFESSSKAITIVSDLLKFARQSELEMERHDLRESIEVALRLAAFPVRRAHVQVIKDLPGEPVMVMYDNRQIEQVLLNIINNAVQAMPDGGTLRLNLSQSQDVAAIAIQDTGTGIPQENLTRIFDPFFTTKPEGEGTGLGLSVSYGIVSDHDGRIDVESEVSVGTTFTILLPVEQPGTESSQS